MLRQVASYVSSKHFAHPKIFLKFESLLSVPSKTGTF